MSIPPGNLNPELGAHQRFRRERRRKKQREEFLPEEIPESYQRIGTVEQTSKQTLPTRVSMALVESRMREKELRRASATLAREFDVDPEYLFEPVTWRGQKALKDPVTGGVFSFASAKRILKAHEPEVIAGILGQLPSGEIPTMARPAPGRPITETLAGQGRRYLQLDPARIAAVFKALTAIDGNRIEFGLALGIAADLVTNGTDLKKFKNNLGFLARVPGIPPQTAIAAAQLSAQDDDLPAFRRLEQAALYVVPPEAEEAVEAFREEMGQRRRVSAEEFLPAEQLRGLSPAQRVAARQAAEEMAAERNLQAQEVEAMGLSAFAEAGGRLLDALKGKEETYDKVADELVRDVRVRREGAANTFFMKTIGTVGNALQKSWAVAFQIPVRGLVGAAKTVTFDVIGHDKDAKLEADDVREDIKDLFHGRTSFAKEVFENELHLPGWTGVTAEFAAGFVLDPLVIGTKGLSALRMGKLVAGGGRTAPDKLADAWRVALDTPHRSFGGKALPAYLVDSVGKTKSAQAFYEAIDRASVVRFGASPIHPTVAVTLYDWIGTARKLGRGTTEITKDVRRFLFETARAKGATGGLTDIVTRETGRQAAIHRRLLSPQQVAAAKIKNGPVAQARALQRRLYSMVSDFDVKLAQGRIPFAAEVPHMSALRSLSLAVRRRVGDQRWAMFMRSLLSHPPKNGITWDIPGINTVKQFRNWAVDSRFYPQNEIDEMSLTLSRLVGSGGPNREQGIVAFLEGQNRELVRRTATKYGFTLDEAEEVLGGIARLSDFRGGRQLFGVRPTASPETIDKLYGHLPKEELARLIASESKVLAHIPEPFLTSQFTNSWTLLDAHHVRRALADSQGILRRFTRNASKALGFDVLGGPAKLQIAGRSPWGAAKELKDIILRDAFLSWWKPLVVLRPAYIWRVPLGDENLRYLATLGVMARIESSHFGAKRLTQIDRLIGHGPRSIKLNVTGGRLKDTLELPRPGMLSDESLEASVSAGTWYGAVGMDDFQSRVGRGLTSRKKGTGGLPYGTVTPQDGDLFYSTWAHSLTRIFGLPPEGRMYLDLIRQGLDETKAVTRALDWMKQRPHIADRLMGRRGYSDEALGIKVRQGIGYARYITGAEQGWTGARVLAAKALNSPDGMDDVLRRMPKDMQPEEIVGLDAALLTSYPSHVKRITAKLYYHILQKPTNVINRHPYAYAWFSRAREGMIRMANETGQKVTPDLIRGIDVQAQDFAAQQVKRIMFDFADQSRFGEMLSFVVPFFQPFTESFVVWGRIIRQNPAVLGYASVAARTMENSGLVRRDPNTGQLVVPMGVFAYAAPLLFAGGVWSATAKLPMLIRALASGVPIGAGALAAKHASNLGVEMVAPLSSFNLFLSTTLDLGGLPVPVPSLSPPAMWALQQLLESDKIPFTDTPIPLSPAARLKLSSWAFEFGPEKIPQSWLPPWLNRAFSTISPGWLDQESKLQATEFLRLQEFMGMPTEAPDEAPPGIDPDQWMRMTDARRQTRWKEYRADLARNQARIFAGMRAWFGALFPASPKFRFETDELEREYQGLVKPKEEGGRGYQAGREEFLRRHPDLWAITIPKTMWEQEISPIPIPASQAVERLLRVPEVEKFAERNPEWVWAMIPSEVRQGKFDPGAYFAQLARNQRIALTPEEFLQSEEVAKGWEAYFAAREQHEAALTGFENRREPLSESSAEWERENIRWKHEVEAIGRRFPTWWSGEPELGISGFQGLEQQRLNPNTLAMARALVKDKLFLKTDAGQGLKEYMELRGRTLAEMREANITSIATKYSMESGLGKRFEDETAAIIERHPDFEIAQRLFFKYDLRGVPTYQDRLLDPLEKGHLSKSEADEYVQLEQDWRRLRSAPFKAAGVAKDEAWLALREFTDHVFKDQPANMNPILVGWKSMREDEKDSLRRSLIGRPYIFMSRFDREVVLGEKTDNATEATWDAYARARLEIVRRKEADPKMTTGSLYEALDEQMAQMASKNPVLAAQLRHANDWTYVFNQTSSFLKSDNAAAPFWRGFMKAVSTVQARANAQELHGDQDFDRDKAALYASYRDALDDYRKLLGEQSVDFRNQWQQLEEENELDDLIEDFVPSFYFPLGGWRYA